MTKAQILDLIKDRIDSEFKKHDNWQEIAARKIYSHLFEKSNSIDDIHFKARLMSHDEFINYFAKVDLCRLTTEKKPEIKFLILEK